MYIVTRLISDVHFLMTAPKLTFKTFNYRHCDTSMSLKCFKCPQKLRIIFSLAWRSNRNVTIFTLSLRTFLQRHTCRDCDYCSKQRRGTSHAIIATYHRSVKKWNVFIDLEYFFRFNSAAMERVSLQKCSVMQT